MPSRQPPAKPLRAAASPGPRTDPALYEWDRLTMEQQRAVLATIGARGPSHRFPRRMLLVALVLLLLIVLVVLLFILTHGG